MAKFVKKQASSPVESNNPIVKAELPTNIDEIFKLKIDRETQQLYIEGQDNLGKFDEVIIRPLAMYNKIVAYNDKFEVKAESTLYQDLKEATDTYGNAATDKQGKLCGRIVWSNLTKDLSESEKEENKSKAKFYTLLIGIATVGKNEPILVDFRVGGKKFMEVINILKKIKEEKKEYNRAELRIKAYPSKDYDWPELEIMPDFSRELPVTGLSPLFDTVEAYVEHHNDTIQDKASNFQQYQKSKPTSFKRK